MNRDLWTDDRRAELARREVERRASVTRVELDTHPRREDAPGGWAVLPSWIGCDPSISPEARVVLLVLSSHADDRAHPFPSIARIARLVGRSERTILRLLAELEGRGLIERLHRFRGGEQVSSAYALRFDRWGRHGRQGEGVSPVTYRGDTGGVRNKTTRPTPEDQDRSPPTPPAVAGGITEEPVEVREARGDRMRRIAREEGIRLRDARRIVEREEHLRANPPPEAASWQEELQTDPAILEELAAMGWSSSSTREYP